MIKTFFFTTILFLQSALVLAIELTPATAYELFAKDQKTAFVDKKMDERGIDALLKVYDKVYINAQHYGRKELDFIISHRKNIHLIIPDKYYDRWNATRLIDRGKSRMLILSSKWNCWDVRRVSERGVRVIVDAKRFEFWDLQKILESGAFVVIESSQLTVKEFHNLTTGIDSSRLIVTTDGEDLNALDRIQRKGAQIVLNEHPTRLDLDPKKRGGTNR